MKTLLEHDLDSVFAASDMMAAGALQAIEEAGLHVPEDISVVGFDDLPVATTTNPPLTTVRQSVDQLGGQAIQILIGLLEGDLTAPCQRKLPTQLVIRESCISANGASRHDPDHQSVSEERS